MLADSGSLHLITTNSQPFRDIAANFELFGTEYASSLRGEFEAVRSFISRYDPSVLVQLTQPPIHGTICGAATIGNDVPFVFRYSGDRFYEWKVAQGKQRISGLILGNILGRLPLLLADEFVALGPSGKDRLTSRGVEGNRITFLPPSIDRSRFEARASNPVEIPEKRSMILFVGRLSRLKGLKTVERTIPRILHRRDDFQFVFAGDSHTTLDIPLRYRDHVTLLGTISPEAIPGYYQQAELLIHPSLTEGIPRAILEALASDTPVVARDVGDVASVTDNTFTSEEEFVEMVTLFESLPIDDVTPFTRESLQPRYRSFFELFHCE